MRLSLALTALAIPLPAFAHVGHLGELAGHSHWIALGALGIATAIGALAASKDKRREDDSADDSADEASEDAADSAEAAA